MSCNYTLATYQGVVVKCIFYPKGDNIISETLMPIVKPFLQVNYQNIVTTSNKILIFKQKQINLQDKKTISLIIYPSTNAQYGYS